MTIEKQIEKENIRELNENGYKQIKTNQSFTRPAEYKKIDWSIKYTPTWALRIPVTEIIYE